MNEYDVRIVEKIIGYCAEISKTHEFFNNDRDLFYNKEKGFVYRNSITMPILQIGELTKNLSEAFRQENKSIPWREIMGMRDIFAHHYGALDYDLAWNTSREDVPGLKEQLSTLLQQ